jgi:predicted negative regulator of RcsB-dependent stress response
MSRLSRQEMKRDEVREWMERLIDWCYENLRLIIQLAVGLLVAFLIAAAVLTYRSNQERKANEALAWAMQVNSAPVVAENADPEDEKNPTFASEDARRAAAKPLFESLQDDYSSTGPGKVAAAYLAEIASDEGDYDSARSLWQSYIDYGRDDALSTAVYLNVLRLDRSRGQVQEVADRLRSELDSGKSPLPEDVLLWELGTTLEEMGKEEEAKESYQRIVDDFPLSAYTQQAQQKANATS